MATYDSLTVNEKDVLSAWERNMRGLMNEWAAQLIKVRTMNDAYRAVGGPKSIADTLNAGEVIPNSGGLDGAQDLDVDSEFRQLANMLNGYLTAYDLPATRRNFTKAAGPTAGL